MTAVLCFKVEISVLKEMVPAKFNVNLGKLM